MTYQVENRFQSLPFKRNLQRYIEVKRAEDRASATKVGLCTLNQVDP
jgi:hypothetical protein